MSKPLIVLLVFAVVAAGAGIYVAIAPTTRAGDGNITMTPEGDGAAASGPAEFATATKTTLATVTSTLTGKVVDSAGAPLRAKIELGEELVGETDDGGNFTKLPLTERREVNILVISASEWHTPVIFNIDGTARPPVKPLKLKTGDNDIGTVKLTVSGAVRGIVVDDRGYAVEGANVSLAGARATRLYTKTESGGGFLLYRVPPGQVTLTIRLGERETTTPAFQVNAKNTETLGSIVLRRSASERSLRGKIVNSADGEGVAGANVKLIDGEVDGNNKKDAYADGTGHFAIIGIADPRKVVKIEVEGHGYPKKEFGPMAPEGEGYIFAVDGGPRFDMYVTDALSGQPIEEFGAWACSPLTRQANDEKPPILKHAGGLVRMLASAQKRTRVIVDAPGYPLYEGHVDFSKKNPEVRIPPGSRVKVKVLRDGRALGKARVFISNPAPGERSIMAAMVRDANVADMAVTEFRLSPDGIDNGRVIPEIRARTADRERITDAAGIVEFEGIPPGNFVAIVTDKNNAKSRSALFEVKAGAAVETIVYAEGPGIVAGQLAADAPEKFAIFVKKEDADDPNFRTSVRPNSDGSFTMLDLGAGNYRATLQFPGDSGAPNFSSPSAVSFRVSGGATTQLQMNAAADGRGSLVGKITVFGARVANLQLRWTRIEPTPSKQSVQIPIDASGDYQIQQVLPGKVMLDVTADGVQVASLGPVEVAANGVHELSANISLGSVRLRAGGTGEVDFQLTFPAPSRTFAKHAVLPCDLSLPCPEGDVSAAATLDGKAKFAKGKVAAGGEVLLEFN